MPAFLFIFMTCDDFEVKIRLAMVEQNSLQQQGPWCSSIYFEEFIHFINSRDFVWVCVFMDVIVFDQGDASLWPAGRVQPACWIFYIGCGTPMYSIQVVHCSSST